MAYVLGVDAGNSKTVALVARLDGAIVGYGRAGCGDIYGLIYRDTSAADALTNVTSAVNEALQAGGVMGECLVSGGFNMAGADWPEDHAFLEAAMRTRGFGRAITVVNDAIGALRAGVPQGVGAAVVCGTGAAIGAYGPRGRVWHGSFWLEPGGSHHLGQKALRAVYRASLGIDPPTALTARVLQLYERETVAAVLHLFTAREGHPPRDLGRVGIALLHEAEQGDHVARRIVQEHGASLGDYALVAMREVGLAGHAFPLVLSGGVLRHPSSVLRDAIVERVRLEAPDVCPMPARFEPVVGALFMALDAAGVTVDNALLERVTATMPPDHLFAT